jgi:hypothetical protein
MSASPKTAGCIRVHKLTAYRSGTQTRLLAAKAQVVLRLTIVLLYEIHTSRVYAHETRARKMHAYDVNARKMHARKIRASKIFAQKV